MSRWSIVLLFLLILFGGGWLYKNSLLKEGWEKIAVGKTELKAQVRDTARGRSQGLSGRESLGDDEGMLFVFPVAAKHGFWMKGMKFDLDFIWIKDEIVVEISEEIKVPKDGERLVTIKPQVAIKKMLEVNSGWVRKNKVKVGDRLELVQ